MFTSIFHKKPAVISFLAKKCSKCYTVASNEYYFIGEISWTTYYRNLIDPLLESIKFPPYCDYILQISITTQLLITACLLQFQWQISQKYNHVTSHWVKWLNFRNSKVKGLPWTILLVWKREAICKKIRQITAIRVFWLLFYKKRKKITYCHLTISHPSLPLKNSFTWVRGAEFWQIV